MMSRLTSHSLGYLTGFVEVLLELRGEWNLLVTGLRNGVLTSSISADSSSITVVTAKAESDHVGNSPVQ